MAIQKILLPTDLTDDYPAVLPQAASLARKFGATVVLFHAIDVETLGRYGEHLASADQAALTAAAEKYARRYLEKIAGLGLLQGIQAATRVVTTEDVAGSILDRVRKEACDLIVLPARPKSGFLRLVMGSVAEQVMRAAPVPVLLSPGPAGAPLDPAGPRPAFRTLLAPTDLSPHADAVAVHVAELARAYGSRVEVLHIFEETIPPGLQLAGISSVLELKPELREKILAQLEARAAASYPGLEHEVHLLAGRPASRISAFAEDEQVDLIAMATQGHDSLGDHFFGSTTDRVVRTAPCPVYVVSAGAGPDASGE